MRYRVGDKSVWARALGTDDVRVANLVLDAWRGQLASAVVDAQVKGVAFDEVGWVPQVAGEAVDEVAKPTAWAVMVRGYLGEIERLHQGSPRTVVAEKSRVEAVFKSLQEIGIKKLQDVGHVQVMAVQGLWSRWGRSPKTQREYLRMARWIFDQAKARGEITDNPWRALGVKGPKVRSDPKPFWTVAEIDQIIEQSPDDYKAYWAVMAYAGLRLQEATDLEWRDVHLDLVQPALVVRMGKGGKTARLPMGPKLCAWMRWQKDRAGHRTKCFFGLRASAQNIRVVLQRCCQGLHFEQVGACTPHRFRHSFASNLVIAGVDIMRVKELMRHSQVKDTMIYAHLRPSDLDVAVGNF